MAKGNKIDLGYKTLEVDGVEYKLGTIPAMSVFRGAAWAMRNFGAPVASALAQSTGLGSFVAKVSDKGAVGEIMALDTADPAEFFATLNKYVEISSILEILGEAVRIAGERLEAREVVEWLRWAVLDLLWVPGSQGQQMLVESESDFNAYLAPHLVTHGPLHALKLFWAILGAHTRPTSAGSPG